MRPPAGESCSHASKTSVFIKRSLTNLGRMSFYSCKWSQTWFCSLWRSHKGLLCYFTQRFKFSLFFVHNNPSGHKNRRDCVALISNFSLFPPNDLTGSFLFIFNVFIAVTPGEALHVIVLCKDNKSFSHEKRTNRRRLFLSISFQSNALKSQNNDRFQENLFSSLLFYFFHN